MLEDDEQIKAKKCQILSGFVGLQTVKEAKKRPANENKVLIQWRMLLRETKLKSLQTDVQYMLSLFEKTSAHKSIIISNLQKQLEILPLSVMNITVDHATNLRRLLDFQTFRLERARDEMNMAIQESVEDFSEKVETWNYRIAERRHALREITYHVECMMIDRLQAEQEEAENKMQGAIYRGRMKKVLKSLVDDTIILRICRKLDSELSKYVEYTGDKVSRRDRLIERYESERKAEKEYTEKIAETKEEIKQLRQTINEADRQHAAANGKMQNIKDRLWDWVLQQKRRIEEERRKTKNDTLDVVMGSHVAIETLRQLQKKASHIIHLSTYSLWWEAPCDSQFVEETILPPKLQSIVEKEGKFDLLEDTAVEDVSQCHLLQNFKNRFNYTVLQMLVLKKEILDLEDANRKLKSMVKSVLPTAAEATATKEEAKKSEEKKPTVQEAALISKNLKVRYPDKYL